MHLSLNYDPEHPEHPDYTNHPDNPDHNDNTAARLYRSKFCILCVTSNAVKRYHESCHSIKITESCSTLIGKLLSDRREHLLVGLVLEEFETAFLGNLPFGGFEFLDIRIFDRGYAAAGDDLAEPRDL